MNWRPISEWSGKDPGTACIFCAAGASPVYAWVYWDEATHFAVLTPPSVSAGPELAKKWTRERAGCVGALVRKISLCPCGRGDQWEYVLRILDEAASDNKPAGGFGRDPWLCLAASLLNAIELLDHGGSMTYAWLTAEGEVLREFLTDFGASDNEWPQWVLTVSMEDESGPVDMYGEWATGLA